MNSTALTAFFVHMFVASGAVLLTGFMLHWLLRYRSAAWRELMWRTVFVVVVCLPLTCLLRPWGMIRTAPVPGAKPPLMAVQVAGQRVSPEATVPPIALTAARGSTSAGFAAILFSIWVSGAILLLGRLFMSARIRRRWLASAREYPEAPVATIWSRISGTAGSRLLVSPACAVPLTWERVVILPEDALKWSDEQVGAALQHEAAHMIRRDLFFRRTGEVVVALFWPQPLVWLAKRLWHRMQEQACDDAVIGAGSDATSYAELLCRVARAWTSGSSGAVAMAQPSSLERRILAVLNPACDRRACSRSVVRTAVVLGFAGFSTASLAQKGATPPATPTPVPAAQSTAQTKASKIVLPRIQFDEARFGDAIKLLSLKAKELDPDKQGIIITGPATNPERKVTLDLRNASLWHVLTVVAEVTGTHLDAGPNGIAFKTGPALRSALPGSVIEAKAQRIKLDRVVFEKATVDEMVQYVRKKSIEADITERDFKKRGLNITTKDAGAGTYSLSLQNVSAWDVLNKIAEVAGMYRAGIHRNNDGVESIILDRSVLYGEALGISNAVARSPQFRALQQLKIAGVNVNGTLNDAAAALSNDIAAASGGKMKVVITVAPAIANERYQIEFPANPAHMRLISLAALGKYEIELDGDVFHIRPKSSK